jgi:threonine dehydrogenase-like Zn-dependent dehydrogenase
VIVVGGPIHRIALAVEAGVGDHHASVVDSNDPTSTLEDGREPIGAHSADLVVECTGMPGAVALGLRLGRGGGSYLIVGQATDSADTVINPHRIVYWRLDIYGALAFGGAHLVKDVQLLPDLLERFNLGRRVTTYPLADHAAALPAVTAGTVMRAVFVGSDGEGALIQ